MAFEEIIKDDKVYVPPVSATDSTVGQVDAAEKQIEYNQTVLQQSAAQLSSAEQEASATAAPAGVKTEGDLFVDIAMEAVGLKAAGSAIQFIDERMGDKAAMGPSQKGGGDSLFGAVTDMVEQEISAPAVKSPGIYKTADSGEDLLTRANIVSDSIRMESPSRLDGKEKFTQTGAWEGKETKLQGVQQAKSAILQNTMKNELLHNNVHHVRLQQEAQLMRARDLSPQLGLGAGPTIRPNRLLGQVEELREEEDWIRRMREQGS